MLALLLAGPVVTSAAQPPATTAAQDGFVPVDESKPQEQLPAAPLVIAAYSVAWLRSSATSGRSGRGSARSSASSRRSAAAISDGQRALMGHMTSAHFIFIPAVLLIGIVIGWVLGSRAAQDAFAAELRKREERERKSARQASSIVSRRSRLVAAIAAHSQSRLRETRGKPGVR